MNIGLCFLINFYLLVQQSNSEPDTILHVHLPPEEQGEKSISHLSYGVTQSNLNDLLTYHLVSESQ